MKMLALPVDVICGGLLPYLSVCDLQALDTAFTNKCLRPQLRQVWKSYQYDSIDAMLTEYDVFWLCRLTINIISLSVKSYWFNSVTNIKTLKKLHAKSNPMCADTLLQLANNSPDLEELYAGKVFGPYFDLDNAVSALAQNCSQLHTLHIGTCDLTDAGATALSQHCHQLRSLHLGDARLTDAGIQALCDNCPHLKHIELLRCPYLTDASLIAIANSYPHLQNIYINFINFTDNILIYFADKCHELRSVSVKCDDITSRGLTALWAANPNLMDVDISENDFISDDDIIQLVQCCPLLQKLNISDCYQITDAAVIAVAAHCPQLRSLNICNCYDVSDASLIALGQHCYKLKSIDISLLDNISDVGIAALAAGCPLLQEFNACNTNITDAGVVALARGCRGLFKVDLDECELVGIAAASAIAENCPLTSQLLISNCNIDDACLYVIAQHCRNLTLLIIDNTKVSNVAAVISVIKSCLMLRQLDCRHCFNSKKAKAALEHCSLRVEVKA